MERIVIWSFLMLGSVLALNLDCDKVDCSWCKTSYYAERMWKDCKSFCKKDCHERDPSSVTQAPRRTPAPRPAPRPAPAGPTVQNVDPNASFNQCCVDQPAVPTSCYGASGQPANIHPNLCNYDNLNTGTLTSAFVYKSCPAEAVAPVLNCASSKADHTNCCTGLGVPAVCHTFCDPSRNAVSVDPKYASCLSHLGNIVGCMRDYVSDHKENYPPNSARHPGLGR